MDNILLFLKLLKIQDEIKLTSDSPFHLIVLMFVGAIQRRIFFFETLHASIYFPTIFLSIFRRGIPRELKTLSTTFDTFYIFIL